MRLVLSILLAANCAYAAAAMKAVPSNPQLLKYGQIMRLSKKKRIVYLRRISQLLVMLEKPQAKYETANTRLDDLREQVALLIRMSAILPEAEAVGNVQPAGSLSTLVPGRYVRGGKACPQTDKVQFIEGVAGCAVLLNNSADHYQGWATAAPCETGTHQLDFGSAIMMSRHRYCVTQSSWDQLDAQTKAKLEQGTLLTSTESSAALAAVTPAAAPSSAQPASVAAAGANDAVVDPSAAGTTAPPTTAPGACAGTAPEACPVIEPGSSAETDMINAFKNSSANGECIRGGYFGHYKGGKYKKGRCERDRAATAKMDKRGSCKAGLERCNPIVFCYGFDAPAKPATATSPEVPASFLVGPTCAKVTQNFTAECEATFQKAITSGPRKVNGYGTQTFRACDPATDIKGAAFQDEYDSLIAQTKESYDRLCGGVPEFKAKFCTECNIIRSHIAKANCEAQAAPSAGTTDGDGPDEAPPAAAPADNGSHPAPGSTDVTQ